MLTTLISLVQRDLDATRQKEIAEIKWKAGMHAVTNQGLLAWTVSARSAMSSAFSSGFPCLKQLKTVGGESLGVRITELGQLNNHWPLQLSSMSCIEWWLYKYVAMNNYFPQHASPIMYAGIHKHF